ncbi:hypothetical protein OS493_038334 [Desmophyllum pertusum]|uniref:Uncharacterized protein n=1 Tax=Desmophyllum pertusum TaxID=174260 RepID=A0A9X0D682_9CNID|nr:hypothetical protein OS493_038334 [Desmophyllum pertusum]
MEHRNLTFLYRNSYSTTALRNIRKERMSTGIPRTVSHLLQSTLACMCLPRRGRDKSLKCSMRNGLSISYDRVLENLSTVRRISCCTVCARWSTLSPSLEKALFTTAAVDNIDHNPTASTAQTSFHGPSVSIFQHPSTENAGDEPNQSLPAPESIWLHLKEEYSWLEEVFLTEDVADAVSITWSAHHATQKRSHPFEVSISAMMPLWRDQAHSVATIKHAMAKVRDTVAFLNPGQTPVIAADQAVYMLWLKQIQWKWPEYGRGLSVLLIMFLVEASYRNGLH